MKWVSLFAFLFSIVATNSVLAAAQYEIEAAHNDELFIINGERFEAKTYCLGWDEGDQVIFIDGSANGICTSAVLFNTNRKEKCEVWCE
jgi:hypothetical protein